MGFPEALEELVRILPRLPEIVGDEWPQFDHRLSELFSELSAAQDDFDRALVARRIIDELKQFGEVRWRVIPLIATSDKRRDGDVSELTWESVLDHMTAVVPKHWTADVEASDVSNAGRALRAWFVDRTPDSLGPLVVGQRAVIAFQVGGSGESNLLAGAASILADDIPERGLQTRWVLSSIDVELTGSKARLPRTRGRDGRWRHAFAMKIGHEGPSRIVKVAATPHNAGITRIDVTVYAGSELFRQAAIDLVIGRPGESTESIVVSEDHQWAAAAHTSLRTTHEWTTPPGHVTLTVRNDDIEWMEDRRTRRRERSYVRPSSGGLKGYIDNLRKQLELFRETNTDYLDDIDSDDMGRRLTTAFEDHLVRLFDEWQDFPNLADEAHRRSWNAVATSDALYKLAADGHQLALQTLGEPVVQDLAALPCAFRVTIKWRNAPVQSIPWGLMYLDAPTRGAAIDPFRFLGLRFRLGYSVHPVSDLSKALGGLDEAYRACLLYWGKDDAAGDESRRQRRELTGPPRVVLLPADSALTKPKDQLRDFLASPTPNPTSILYFFCQCTVDEGANPELRFDVFPDPDAKLDRFDLAFGTKLADQPLVFANACETSSGRSDVGSLLEQGFFGRGCRAFIGTEAKVPIRLASRIARVFFAFLLRDVDPQRHPMCAGEAMTHARLFLWSQYRNIGGLFYNYVNEYELYLATEDEVQRLTRW